MVVYVILSPCSPPSRPPPLSLRMSALPFFRLSFSWMSFSASPKIRKILVRRRGLDVASLHDLPFPLPEPCLGLPWVALSDLDFLPCLA